MKAFLTALIVLTSFNSFASGWLDVNVLKGTVLTQSQNSFIALGTDQQPNGYECRLDLKLEHDLASYGVVFQDRTWTRLELHEDIHFPFKLTSSRIQFDDDRTSECLSWSEVQYEDGIPHSVCLKYAKQFQTKVSILNLSNKKWGVNGELSCSKRFEMRDLDLDRIYKVIKKMVWNRPVYLDLELD